MTDAPTRYCDLVMKGGITSGIVYPSAVLALRRDFRFKNIGGTSAGAIAAAASAAAAAGDRRKTAGQACSHDPAKVGFEGLEQVADRLSTEGFIASLFQPASGAKQAHRLLVTLTGHATTPRKAVATLLSVVTIAPIETLLLLGMLLALGFALAGPPGIAAALLPALLCAYAAGAIAAVLRVARVARRNLLGLCSGIGASPTRQALTDWLHQILQELAGKPIDDPLTFDDLWSAPRYPGEPATEKAISLQMITTSVSHHEPRTLPFVSSTFWFVRDEFDRLFPKLLVDRMVAEAGPPREIDGRLYYRLPVGGRLPVIVATRMSLSFPLLISAVPLHEPASQGRNAAADEQEARAAAPQEASITASMEGLTTGGDQAPAGTITAFRVCWFSDGGISSNFPIHLFDAPLPLWPTFAINLIHPDTDETYLPGSATDAIEAAVFLPTENNQGWQYTYRSIARRLAVGEIAGFLFGIVATMQNWRDLLQSRAPGQRDRIVHVSLDRNEGGLNLNMPQHVLTRIAAKGTAAGNRLYGFSFDNHYWIRWRNLASALQGYSIQIAVSENIRPRISAYEDAHETVRTGTPPPPSYPFRSQEKRAEAERLYRDLLAQGESWEDLGPNLSDNAPRPLPQMRITPTY